MADSPEIELQFQEGCDDCGRREVRLPPRLPALGDDFDWDLRDYDGFRLFMLEELAARFPERKRWTPADLEVVLVEALAAVLDQLSDTLDRVAGEAYLETARRPESVRRLLLMIGYDALGLRRRQGLPPFDGEHDGDPIAAIERLEQYWLDHPEDMERDRQEGPRQIHRQHRIVTTADFVTRLEAHPVVERAQAAETWNGSWSLIQVAVIPWARVGLDAPQDYDDALWTRIEQFHAERDLYLPGRDGRPPVRSLLRHYLDDYRMVGQEVQLVPAEEVGLSLSLSIQVAPHYFQSEVRRAVEQALGTGPGGFFEPGRLRFGEDVWAGDLFQYLMALDGVENLCLNRFKRIGTRFPDMSGTGRIALNGLELAVCDNEPEHPERGYFHLRLHGGRRG
ncbi:hypothetical protein ACN2MM_09475 [Alkalilimnicola ehrlichii MLHE-1]|uniref:Baseplate protein J-like domain-containing protein n=1 Tax=Alkalilimnicola ehrlichii (strain ATCC BAA-1101 / DSM 17681 / MLHE-1) TaxID=187272 RepID=Q0A7U5_ALKEH|nr:hypothetical protein [Alkalilimnicola ehrlichii]ABI57092.1 conserved hypothetical protein [Alkalilimnicola ehrlichii MLHE-1]